MLVAFFTFFLNKLRNAIDIWHTFGHIDCLKLSLRLLYLVRVTFVVKRLQMLLRRIWFHFDLEIFYYYWGFSIQLNFGLLFPCVLVLFYFVTDRDWVLVGAGWLTWLEILVQVVNV